jgi:mono/diheme cytochrome c family protein
MLQGGDRIYDVYAIEEEAKAIDEAVTGNHGVVPLYRSPTLTDAEREAIAWAARSASLERGTAADAASRGYKPEGGGDPAEWARAHGERAATLRGLLERTK